MKLSYDATWQHIALMLRAHADIILVMMGVFVLLPALAQMLYFPPPALTHFSAAAIEAFLAYYQSHFLPIFVIRLVTLLGTGALLALLLCADRPTVGEAIGRAGRLLPTLLLVDVLSQILIAFGLIALLLPGLYLMARLALAAPVVMSEAVSNPLTALRRSFTLTDKIGWQVFGLIAIIMIVVWIAVSAMLTVLGVMTELLLPEGAVHIARAVLGALNPTLLLLASTLLSAGLYRQIIGLKSGT